MQNKSLNDDDLLHDTIWDINTILVVLRIYLGL